MGKGWTFWQYTASGDGPAFGAESKAIDVNLFNGSMEDLKKFAGISGPSGEILTRLPNPNRILPI